jgi:hypothetical protein
MARCVAWLACAMILAACQTDRRYSQTELSALQTRTFAASYDQAFDAAVNALFDRGYQIRSSDKRGGFLSAAFMSGNAWTGFESWMVQLKIEGAGAERTSVRVSTTDGFGQQHVNEEHINELLDLIDRRLLLEGVPPEGRP